MYVQDEATRNYARATMHNNRSALEYYISAYQFSVWVKDNLGDLTMHDVYDKEGNVIEFEANQTGEERIFNFNSTTNNPEKTESTLTLPIKPFKKVKI